MAATDAAASEAKLERVLREPFAYICEVPGKEIRSKLIQAFDFWLHIPEKKLQGIKEVTQMLHNASLMIDDIEDNSLLRRGKPVAHSVFGVPTTINSANYIYFVAMEKALNLDHPQAVEIFIKQMLQLHRGQGKDIYWRDSGVCPTEEEYHLMVQQKTGGLFTLAVGLMQLFSENKSDFSTLLDILGLYFQIRDDYANLLSTEYSDNKSFCEDLSEGKFSFPVIYGIHSKPDDTQLINIIRRRTDDIEVKKYCVKLLHKVGAFTYTRSVLSDLESRAFAEIKSLGGNEALEQIIVMLSKLYQTEPSL